MNKRSQEEQFSRNLHSAVRVFALLVHYYEFLPVGDESLRNLPCEPALEALGMLRMSILATEGTALFNV